jgi:3-deoxy-D-manno-octulosonate 8-phosphate phosphatase (KDO 8-P phosphatase)
MITAERARAVRLLALDVDGVLTDNGIYLGPIAGDRVELKRFDIQDGLAHTLLRFTDIDVAWVSGRHSDATTLRASELRVSTVLQLPKAAKLPAMEQLLGERGLAWSQVAFVGDDLADLPVLRRAGLPIAVANAVDEVKAVAAYVTRTAGGHGAVRDAIEAILRARGEWESAIARYLTERGEPAA